jgi:replicative DNA helicase
MADPARKQDAANDDSSPLYREAPGNIEAEQALLGAILVNNDAFYRVSETGAFLRAVAPPDF